MRLIHPNLGKLRLEEVNLLSSGAHGAAIFFSSFTIRSLVSAKQVFSL